jgi:hypothetical protein
MKKGFIVDLDPNEEEKMNCGICGESIGDCRCPDMDERMKRLRNHDRYIYKMCAICGRHHERCKCEKPEWISSHKDVPLEKLISSPTLADMVESAKAKEEGRLH